MNFWNQAPMFRLLIPFVAGIITGVFMHRHFQFQEYIAIAALLVLLVTYFRKKIYTKYRFRIFFGLFVDIGLFILAYTLTISKTESLNASHFSRAYKKGTLVLVQLDERPVEREKTYKLIVDVLKVKCDDAWKDVSGHALLYLQKDSSTSGLSYGDILLIRPDFKEIPPPQNPGEFNYKRYLGFHQIGWQSYLPASKCILTGKNRGSAVYYHAQHLRQACLEVFSDHGLQGDEYAVASALILGYKDALDDQIRHSFASAGAMHVLAVSGLHVGIIFLVLKSLLGFLERLKYGVFIKTFIMLSGLWFYAALTGFSPSVMRATTMFSFILIGKAMNRTAVIYNTLAASAFALLLFNPFLIMEVGFQLSYLAVVGIVFIQPRLYHIWHPKLWIIDKIWAITTVSLAAQIATFPLGLLYFHQFPNYFLFSNLIVIPMAAVILYNGMLVLALSFSDILCHWASVVLSAFVHFLNTAVGIIESLPHAILGGISINIAETYLIYSFVILLLSYIIQAQVRYLRYTLLSIGIFTVLQLLETHKELRQQLAVIYNVPGQKAYDFISGHTSVFIADSSLIHDEEKLLFRVRHHWWSRGITKQNILVAGKRCKLESARIWVQLPFIQFRNKRFAVIDRTYIGRKPNSAVEVDYIILSQNARISIPEIIRQFHFKKIIFDSSNAYYTIQRWQKEADELKLETVDVSKNGAYIINV